jgi:cytochrome c oxidase assembly factor CtaG
LYFVTRPVAAIVVANAIVVVWHLPFAYDAAIRHEPIHIAQHLMFLAAATIAWWPVLGSMPSWPKLVPPLQALYLFAFSIPGGIVGAFITLAEPGLYTAYVGAPRIWGISLETDQQVAGLMMWVLTSVIYLAWITVIFLTWASREEAADRGERPRRGDSSTPSVLPGVR